MRFKLKSKTIQYKLMRFKILKSWPHWLKFGLKQLEKKEKNTTA